LKFYISDVHHILFLGGVQEKSILSLSSLSPKRILVTGAAGFVGFHLCLALSNDPQNVVVALDNFNDYYDVKLKIVS